MSLPNNAQTVAYALRRPDWTVRPAFCSRALLGHSDATMSTSTTLQRGGPETANVGEQATLMHYERRRSQLSEPIEEATEKAAEKVTNRRDRRIGMENKRRLCHLATG